MLHADPDRYRNNPIPHRHTLYAEGEPLNVQLGGGVGGGRGVLFVGYVWDEDGIKKRLGCGRGTKSERDLHRRNR